VPGIAADGKFAVKFEITNDSSIEDSEIVQVYISGDTSSLPRPVEELKVNLRGGETRTKAVQLGLDREGWAFMTRDG
jgi:hypothetical protein